MKFWHGLLLGGAIGGAAGLGYYAFSDYRATGTGPDWTYRMVEAAGGAVGGATLGIIAHPSGWIRTGLAVGLGGLAGAGVAPNGHFRDMLLERIST